MKKSIFVAFIVVFFSACTGTFEKVQKSKDFDYKLQKANEYYDKKQFSKANLLYEELLPVYKGTKTFEGLYYKYAYSYFYDKNYLAASYHFKNFADLFPKSPNAEECEYLNSLCLHKMSPEYTLDQTNTVKSISEMQNYINTHPESKRVKDADKMIEESREKLEVKDAYGAELYYKISEYKAAAVAFEQLLRKYPDSKKAEYYMYMIAEATYKYAKNSVPEKQEERFNNTMALISNFKEKYPKSTYSKELDRINALSLQAIKKIASK